MLKKHEFKSKTCQLSLFLLVTCISSDNLIITSTKSPQKCLYCYKYCCQSTRNSYDQQGALTSRRIRTEARRRSRHVRTKIVYQKRKKDGTFLLPWKPFCHRSEVVVFFATKHFLLSQEKSVIDPYDFSVCVVHESFFNVKHLYKIMLLPLSFFVVVNDFSARCRARPPVLFHSSLLACYLTLAQQLAGRKVVK